MKKLTKRVSLVSVYEDNAQVKVYLTKAEFKKLEVDIGDKAGALATIWVSPTEWDVWHDEMPDSFLQVFGEITFEVDGAEYKENKNPMLPGSWQLIGFRPAGKSRGSGLYPNFDKMRKRASKKEAAPAGAIPTPKSF